MGTKAWLVSEPIPCLLVPSYLTFYYWKNTFLSGLFRSSSPRFRVYMRQPPWTRNLELLLDLSENNRWGWRFSALEVPPVNEPFQVPTTYMPRMF